jgi:nitroreductase
MPDMPLTPDELLAITRSVRKRLDLTRPMPLDLVKECLEIALQAPSGGMRQGWHWIVVTDPEVRAQIGDFYRRSTELPEQRRGRPEPGRGGRQRGHGPGEQQLRVPRPAHGPGAGAGDPVHHGAVRLAGRGVTGRVVGIAAARRVELHAGLPGQGPRYRLDHTAPAIRDGDRWAARAPR